VHTDLYSALLELASPVRRTADGAVAELARLRTAAVACGAVLVGAGIHPAQPFGGVHHLDDQRYRKIAGDMRGLVARTPTCALHVHVGLPDVATAIRVTNGMRDHLPLVEALSANSPFRHGVDSGLASARRPVPLGPTFGDTASVHMLGGLRRVGQRCSHGG
jgi:glutamate---cysteine ligase / carboxylate-amine ligase